MIKKGSVEEMAKSCKEVLSGFDRSIYNEGFESTKSIVYMAGNLCFKYGLNAKKRKSK